MSDAAFGASSSGQFDTSAADSQQRGLRAGEIARLITGYRYTFRDEEQLHDALAEVFAACGVQAEREVRLSSHDRIDFLIGRVGLEVKTDGATTAVARQLQRYARHDRIDTLVLVTTVARHRTLPPTIGGKPLIVASLLDSAL